MMIRATLPAVVVAALGSCTLFAKDKGKAASPPVGAVPTPLARLARFEIVARGLDKPVDLRVAPGDRSGRLFVAEKSGRIRVLRGGTGAVPLAGNSADRPFLDLSDRVSDGGEQGLLGFAFHPRFPAEPRIYVNYTDKKGDTRVVEFRTAKDAPDRVDANSARELLYIPQPYANHNGGNLAFASDGRLYVGTGDGGAARDPFGNGQNPKSLLGKMLRIDVDAAHSSAEIVALGLRNPWRYAFDPKTEQIFIGDVGQDRYEEIDVVSLAALAGANFGWNRLEGLHCLDGEACDARGTVAPVVEYDHRAGCSVTGGVVYRGRALPELDGIYFFADFCTGLLHGFRWQNGAIADYWDWRPVLDPARRLAQVTSFGVDADGEIYVLSLDGMVWKLVRS